MKVVGKYNNVSDVVKPTPLEKGQKASYRLLNGRLDYARKDDNGKPIMTYGKAIRIPTSDRIWDPGLKAFVDIGVVQEFKNDIVTRTKAYYATPGGDYINNGIFELSGSSNSDVEFYEFFEMSNFNKSFKYRDESIEPLYERIDEEAENKVRFKKLTQKTEALITCSQMSVEELRQFAAQMNWDERAEPSVLKLMVGEFAESDPAGFLKVLGDEHFSLRAVVKQATTKEIIGYDPVQHRIIWHGTDQTIAKLDRVDGKNYVDIFAEWLATAANGSSVKSAIEKKLRGSKKQDAQESEDGDDASDVKQKEVKKASQKQKSDNNPESDK